MLPLLNNLLTETSFPPTTAIFWVHSLVHSRGFRWFLHSFYLCGGKKEKTLMGFRTKPKTFHHHHHRHTTIIITHIVYTVPSWSLFGCCWLCLPWQNTSLMVDYMVACYFAVWIYLSLCLQCNILFYITIVLIFRKCIHCRSSHLLAPLLILYKKPPTHIIWF